MAFLTRRKSEAVMVREEKRDIGKKRISTGVHFLRREIWKIRQRDLPPRKSFLIGILKVGVLSVRRIAEDRISLRASALTFYSLLSVVPVMAMAFGIAKGFGFEKNLQGMLLRALEGQEAVALRVMDFAHALLRDVRGGAMAGVGLVILFFSIIKILSHTENAFNAIWGVKKGRGVGRMVTDYLSILLIGTILFVISSGITVFISGGMELAMRRFAFLVLLGPGITFLLKLLPLMALWILFSFLYVFIPNTKVSIKAGLLGGILSGTLYHLFQWAYVALQVGVAKQNAVYGSFAALPLFFTWLQVSWMIMLLGAEISFAYQNAERFEFEEECLNVSYGFKRLLALRVAQLVTRRFTKAEKPLGSQQISQELEMPTRLMNQILYELVASGILSEIKSDRIQETAYEPARDPEVLTIKYVVDALERNGTDDIPVARSEELELLAGSLKRFSELAEKSEANLLLKRIG
jgi:membrane protein